MKFISSLLILALLFAATIADIITQPIISSGLIGTDTQTYASIIWECNKEIDGCLQTQFKITYPQTLPDTVTLRITHNLRDLTTLKRHKSIVEDVTLAAPSSTGETIALTQFQQLQTDTKFNTYRIESSFFFSMKWAAAQSLTMTEPTALKTTVDISRDESTLTHTFEIQSYWGKTLALNENLDTPQTTIEPTEFSSSFDVIPAGQLPSTLNQGSTAYRTSIAFTNYNSEAIRSIDLALTGPFYWNVNTTQFLQSKSQMEYCTLNGLIVKPTLPFKNNQTITLPIPVSIRLSEDTLIVINCGLENAGLELINNSIYSKMIEDATTPTAGPQSLTILPTYTTSSAEPYPQSLYVYPIDPVSLKADSDRTGTQARIQAVFSHVDERLENDEPAALSSIFSLEMASIEDYSRPVQFTVSVRGLVEKSDANKTNKKAVPRAIVTIEPDYSIEMDVNEFDHPQIPATLRAPSFILPIGAETTSAMNVLATGDIWTTPALQLDEGLFITYQDTKKETAVVPTELRKMPKRFISVIIPQDAIDIVSYPVDIRLTAYFPSTAKTEAEDNSYTVVSALFSLSRGSQSSRAKQWKSDRMKNKKLEFDVKRDTNSPNGYPDNLSATFPSLKYRFVFPPLEEIDDLCTVLVETCTTRWVTRRERYCPTSRSSCYYRTVNRRVTSCSYDPDSSISFKPTYLSQNRIDVSVGSKYTGICSGDCIRKRRIKCEGTWIVEQKPYVFDLRQSNPSTMISTSAINKEVVKESWATLQEGQVSSVVAHTFSKDGAVVGYSEKYSLKGGLSTGAIIALCLIPLYIAVIIGVIVLVIMVSK